MTIDDEAERLARLTGWNGRSEVTPSTFQLNGERPKPPKVSEDVLRARADADIERMWAEDDGTDYMRVDEHKVPIRTVHYHVSGAPDTWQQSRAGKSRLATDWLRVGMGYGLSPTRADVKRRPKNELKTKPAGKTYVAPGRKAGKAWIDRLNQSKQAKKR